MDIAQMQESKFDQLEESLGVHFNDQNLLKKALMHRSFLNENPEELESNERLEFLGDAVLEFVISEILFREFPGEDEGHLTVLRSRLVNTISLASTAKQLNLGAMLFLSRGEEKSGGRENTSLLADTVEAILGAIYLDQGLVGAELFIKKFIVPKITEVIKKSLKDAKSLLQEYVQANGYSAPVYKTISEIGPDHAKVFTVEVLVNRESYAQGTGSSKQIAAQNAAQNALEKWASKTK